MVKGSIKQLNLDYKDSLAIDESLKGEGLEEYEWLLLQVGWCLVNQKSREIGVSERDLWFLRSRVSPRLAPHLIEQIYKLLLEYQTERIGVLQVPEKRFLVEYKYANQDKDETCRTLGSS